VAYDEADTRRPAAAEGVTEPLPADALAPTAGLPQPVLAPAPEPVQQAPVQHAPAQPLAPQHAPVAHAPGQHAPSPYAQRPAPPRRDEPLREQTLERSYRELAGPSRGRRAAVLGACALLGVAIGVAGHRYLTGGGSEAKAAPSSAPAAAAKPVSATVSSVSPSGSGFRKDGNAWTSQRYESAKFGNLKPGIGLLLDLGSARTLTAVTFTATTSPLTVELRAGDDKGNDADGYAKVGSPVTAKGSTSLPATAGGSHRYWLVWVTSLAPDDGKFGATITSVAAKG
jgi:hypothetical protein